MVHYDHVLITENLIILLLILLLRNSYPLSLISELLERINKAKKNFFYWIGFKIANNLEGIKKKKKKKRRQI